MTRLTERRARAIIREEILIRESKEDALEIVKSNEWDSIVGKLLAISRQTFKMAPEQAIKLAKSPQVKTLQQTLAKYAKENDIDLTDANLQQILMGELQDELDSVSKHIKTDMDERDDYKAHPGTEWVNSSEDLYSGLENIVHGSMFILALPFLLIAGGVQHYKKAHKDRKRHKSRETDELKGLHAALNGDERMIKWFNKNRELFIDDLKTTKNKEFKSAITQALKTIPGSV